MTIQNYKIEKISGFLSSDTYYIPQYQRGYSWEESQVEDFWIDLMQLLKSDANEEHFLGQVVVHADEEDRKKYIIDGQQRVSTSVILLDVFRTKFDELAQILNNEDARNNADDINAQYIGRITETKKEPKLWMGDTNKKFFFDLIQKRTPINYTDPKYNKKVLNSTNYNVFFASQYFMNQLNKKLNGLDPQEQVNTLEKIYKCFIDNFKVMSVQTNDINEAYIIFETLNARGKELETSDLLKNHVLRTAKEEMDVATDKWNLILSNLDGNDLTKFIRYYWNSKHDFIREKDLYKALRKDANTPKKVDNLLNDLLSLSELYVALLSPDENSFYEKLVLNERISEIHKLKATSFYPIMFALQEEQYSEDDIDDVLSAIESLVVRNFVVAGKTANRYEIEFSKIAYQISERELSSAKAILEKVNSLIISDEEFENNFKTFKSKTGAVIRYILRKINNYSTQEVRIIDDAKTVHVEHILPKNRSQGEWKAFSEEDHSEYLWRLGNLTLLGQEYNNKAKNKEFNDKKAMYEKSSIAMTKELVEIKTWTKSDIENRQKEFAKLAMNIWKK